MRNLRYSPAAFREPKKDRFAGWDTGEKRDPRNGAPTVLLKMAERHMAWERGRILLSAGRVTDQREEASDHGVATQTGRTG